MSDHDHHKSMGHSMHSAKMHGPVGMMGDHLLKKGKSMLSISYMKMSMNENYIDAKKISDQEILKLPNPGGMPKNISVVPQEMYMDMVMLGAMHAPTNSLTLMGMTSFTRKYMKLRTYQPMMERNPLGDFTTKSSDLSTVNLSALFKIRDAYGYKFHAQLGLEKNLGKNSLRGMVLMPMGSIGSIPLPYGMQSGDKSLSLLSALTFSKIHMKWKLGGQIKSKINLDSEEWNFGDRTEINLWAQRDLNKISAWSLRLKMENIDSIEGFSEEIKAPVQTSNPLNYGGTKVSIGLGINTILEKGIIGVETVIPIKQDLNGPQMSLDWGLQIGYHLSF